MGDDKILLGDQNGMLKEEDKLQCEVIEDVIQPPTRSEVIPALPSS